MWQTLHNLTKLSTPQEENSRTNEKREIYAKPLLTFIVIWEEQIRCTPKGKSLLSKAAQKRMTDSWMVSVKQLSDTLFSLNCSQSKHSMSSCLTKMFLYSGKLARWKCVFIWALYLLQTECGTLWPWTNMYFKVSSQQKNSTAAIKKQNKKINEWIQSQSCKC